MEKSQFRQVKSKKTRKHMVEMLNQRVADLTDLFVQTKLAHFIAYHELFDKLAGHIPDLIDTVAEQAASLGGAVGKPVQFIASETSDPPWPLDENKDLAVLETLTERWFIVANSVREAVDTSANKDPGTSDLFTEVCRQLDKNLWYLDAHLTDGKVARSR